MGILDSLLVELGYDYDPEGMKDFQEGITETIGAAKKLVAGLIAGSAAITGFAAVVSAATDEQGKLAEEIGISVGEIDALSHALGIAGGNTSSMANNLQQLAIRASEAARGVGSGVEAFGILGISVTDVNGNLKSTDDLLLEVSQSMQGLDKAKQIELADKLGLRDSVRLLQKGSAGIQQLVADAKSLGVTTEEDARLSAEFQDSLLDITRIGKKIGQLITRTLIPILQGFNDEVAVWWKQNKDLIEQNIPKWIDKLSVALKILTVVAGLFVATKLIGTILSLVKAFKIASVAALVMNGAVLLLPTLLTGLALAFVGLMDDAQTFFEGGDSLFGIWIEKFPEFETELRAVAGVFYILAEVTSTIFEGWKNIFDLFSGKNKTDFSQIGNFLLDIVGLGPVSKAESLIAPTSQSTNNSKVTKIDKIEITIPGAQSPEAVVKEFDRKLKQTAQDINSAVYQ